MSTGVSLQGTLLVQEVELSEENLNFIKKVNFAAHLISLGVCGVGSQLTERSIIWIVPALFCVGNFFLSHACLSNFQKPNDSLNSDRV